MEDKYKKSKGNAGLDGVQFQLNLLTVFLLNSIQSKKNWKISTENQEAGKYDDLVIELPDKSVLLQAKFKQNKKINRDQLLSCNSRNADFSLPKYFLSYLEVKSESIEKTVIICTNTDIDENGLENFLTRHPVNSDSMLYYEGSTRSFFTLNENMIPDLKAGTEAYIEKNMQGKIIDKTVITDENVKDFLKHFQIFSSYPSGGKIDEVIEQLLSNLNSSNLYCNVSAQEIYKKVEDWFKQPKGEYLTEQRAKAMFSEIKSDKYCQELKNYKVSFKHNNFNFSNANRIFQIISEGVYLLQALKIYDALQKDQRKKLYVNPEDDFEVQKRVIEAFELPRFSFLIIIGMKITEETTIKEINNKLRDIVKKCTYKKVILVAQHNDRLCQQLGLNNIFLVNGSVMLHELSDEYRKRLVKQKSINFQGQLISLEELLATHTSEDWSKAINSELLEKLIRKKEIKVGVRPSYLNELNSRCYVNRTLTRQICKNEAVEQDSDELNEKSFQHTISSNSDGQSSNNKMREESFPEESIFDVNENVILIADSAGMGKSTFLTKLATTIKDKNPHLWVIEIDLTEYASTLRDVLVNGGKNISVMVLLNSKRITKLTNHLERFVYSMDKKVVLMLDGIDEISPDYTELVLNLLSQCRQETNFTKLFLTTRPHMVPELEKVLKVKQFMLQPFTELNQVQFLTNYWCHNLNSCCENIGKCERYAKVLLSRMTSWTKGYHCKDYDFTAIPLQLVMLAEIFQESVKWSDSSVWEGLEEYLQETREEPKLPEKIEIKKLYDMFIEKKRDIYMCKGNPSGNSAANKALREQFNESLIHHRRLALEVILHEQDCHLFSCYQQNCGDIDESILKIGIVQGSNDEFHFIHRTFAEYFVAECFAEELQLQLYTPEVKFQQGFINNVLQYSEYKIIRIFLDNLLQKDVDVIPSNIFANYQSHTRYPDYWTQGANLLHLLAEEGCVTLLHLVLKCIDFKIITCKEINIADFPSHIVSKKKNVFQSVLQKIGSKKNMEGNVLKILQFLVREAGLNIKDRFGRTPLHWAANSGHFEVVKFLVVRGADVDSVDRGGYTALNLAAAIGQADVVKYLIDHGANVSIRNFEGRGGLHFAVKSARLDTVKHLIKSGCDANTEDDTGRTPLHFAAAGGQLAIVEYLVRTSDDVNVYDNKGRTPLHFAAAREPLALVEHLVKFCENVDIKDQSGRTALHFAAAEGQLENVECLLKSSSKVNVQDRSGRTALHFAAVWGHLSVVEHIVKSGGDVKLKDKNGFTPLQLAAQNGQLDTVKFLAECDVGLSSKTADCGAVNPGKFL